MNSKLWRTGGGGGPGSEPHPIPTHPPPPSTPVDEGVPMYILCHGTPPGLSREKLQTFYGLFHIISTPFLYGTFPHLTSYLGNIMMTRIPFLLFSSGSGNRLRILPIPSGGGGAYHKIICNIIRALPLPFVTK